MNPLNKIAIASALVAAAAAFAGVQEEPKFEPISLAITGMV